ncbi:retrotransposon protein, putative, ty1-copia subclass [Tanacetum coccineum]|uniref:Retrotransposon protein, putative, ty1-copia subclass n=1 Tax=Tanacetum coccineum TaxID=301880 RepID=A0ABQ5A1U9_9ASTR
MTTTVVNNSLFRSLFEKQKLTRNNFLEWYHNLWIVLSTKDKLPFLEQPIPVLLVPPQGQANPPDVVTTHQAWVKAHKEIVGLMLMTMDLDIQKNLEHLGAYDMLKELKKFYIENLEHLGHAMTQNLSVSLILVSLRKEYDSFVQNYNMHSMGKTKNQKKKSYKAAKGNQGKGKAKIGYAPVQAPPFAPKPKNPPTPKKDNPAKDVICHQCGKVGHWRRNCPIYLSELMKKKKLSHGASTSVKDSTFVKLLGLMGSRKLKPGDLSLYVGDGHRAAIEAIGDYHLCLPSGLVLILHNCHYAPSITRGIILDDIYGIVMSSSNTNESSMYAVTNKRAKLNLDSALLWHCHLRHINKKRIEKLQHDGLLDSTDIKSFEKCVACMSDYALESAVRIVNMVPTKKVDKTPYEVWHGQASKLFYLKVWGCETLVKHDTLTKLDKLEPRAFNCIFVGYPKETIGYSFYYPPENKVFVARFFENEVIDHEASGSLEDLEIIQEGDTHHLLNTSLDHEEDDQEIDEPQTALLDPESDKWLNAMNVEMQFMKDNEVWELVELPPSTKTVDIRAIRILIAIAAFYDYEIWQIDVKTAFLNRYLNEDVYMEQPEENIEVEKILKRFYMENSKCGTIPMQEKLKLSKSQGASTPAEIWRMQNVPYASAVASIMYAVRCTRPDVTFAQNITSRFQQNPSELHWTTIKNILKYLRNTKDMFLVYGGDMKQELKVSCYTDAGYLTDADDMKSQTAYVFILNGGVVDWKSIKQSIFATSSIDAEYIAAFDASKEAVWIRKFISGLGVVPTIEEPINMYCDNTRAIAIAKDHGITKGARHFCAKVNYL